MGKLTERYNSLPAVRKRTCAFGRWLSEIDADDRETVFALLENPDWTVVEVAVFLRKEAGVTISDKSVSRHRKHECLECTYESFG